MRLVTAWPLIALLKGPFAQAPSQPRAKIDVSKLGPQVGRRVLRSA
jgi:hypothetical protein